MVIPPWYELPPRGYGGTELICAALVDSLCARGHDVTVFGAGTGTGTAGRFLSTMPELQHPRLNQGMPDTLHAARVSQLLSGDNFDVVHDHSLVGPLTAATRTAPTVVTVHGRPDGELGDYYASLGDQIQLVAISESQRRQRSDMNWVATVYNAVNTTGFAAEHNPDGPVLWLARFSPDKGPDLAIEACRAAGLPLVLAGKAVEACEKQYLDDVIRPMLGDDVQLIVNGDRETTDKLFPQARCLIMPIRWHEPFGMVMIEAMASGTPVVALRRGSVPEVVTNGVTGWICDDPTELPGALLRVGELRPDDCVARVRTAFSADLMARRYERVYRRAIAGGALRRRPSRSSAAPRVVVAPTTARPLATVRERPAS
jgi:glycosyltransferase involved in cell wall biosynthesis